jgi:hypothetical protein
VAQSWAATWHPIICGLVNVKFGFVVAGGVEPATYRRANELRNRASHLSGGGACYVNQNILYL